MALLALSFFNREFMQQKEARRRTMIHTAGAALKQLLSGSRSGRTAIIHSKHKDKAGTAYTPFRQPAVRLQQTQFAYSEKGFSLLGFAVLVALKQMLQHAERCIDTRYIAIKHWRRSGWGSLSAAGLLFAA